MRKYISVMLAVMLLISILPVDSVFAVQGKFALRMESQADVLGWKIGWGGTNTTASNVSQDYVKTSTYAFKLNRLDANKVNQYALSVPVSGNKNAYMWVYADVNASYNVILRCAIGFASGVASNQIHYTLKPGWNLMKWSLTEAQSAATISQVSICTFGYEADNNVASQLQNTTIYVDGLFLTSGELAAPEITGATIEEGERLVKHDVGKVSLTAPGILRAGTGGITLTPAVAGLSTSVTDDTLTINFNENLTFGETYTLAVNSGIYDEFGMEFKPYTLSFRVRGENENISPSVEMTSPTEGTRFVPGDEIILTVVATDDPATTQHGIQYVEFYCNNVLIEGSRVTEGVNDVYTFVWGGAEESFDNYRITAKAVDVEGAAVVSDPVSILILGYKEPTVNITSPEDGTVIYNSVSGVINEEMLTVTADIADLDSELAKAEIWLDGELVDIVYDGLDEFSYTFDDTLSAGSHTIEIIAADDMDLTGSAQITLTVIDLGVSYPAMLKNDLTLAKWSITGNIETLEKTEEGIVISTVAEETVHISRTLTRDLSLAPWQADAKIISGDTTHTIDVGITNSDATAISMITFGPDGTMNDDNTTAYEAYKEYDISIVADTINGKISCLVDGKLMKTLDYTATDYSANAAIYVQHSGANAATIVKSAEFFMLKEAAQLDEVKIFSGTANADLNSVPLLPSYIDVHVEGGTDYDTVEGNVKVYDTQSGKEIAVSYSDGKVYFEEFLKSGKEYTVSIGSGVAGVNNRGLAGVQTISFTVEKAPLHIEMTEESGSLKVSAENTSGVSKDAKIIMTVIKDNKDVLPVAVTDFTIGTEGNTAYVPLPAVEQGAVIEAFVVDNLTDLKPISDSIFIKE